MALKEKVEINYSAEIEELANRYSAFKILLDAYIRKEKKYRWRVSDPFFNLYNERVYELQVMFIGKTGYGKSTTLNTIIGKNVFNYSDVSAITKELYCSRYIFNKNQNFYLSLNDLPGIGESKNSDLKYYEWYRDMFKKTSCVVYVLRADQRDFSIDEICFNNMFKTYEEKSKVILALNCADKIEPINRNSFLSSEQIMNLNKKLYEVSKIFNISTDNILYYSAADKINIDILTNKICSILKKELI